MVFYCNILLHDGVCLQEAHHSLRLGNLKITSGIVGEHGGAEGLVAIICIGRTGTKLFQELLLQVSIVLSWIKDIFLPFRDTCFFYCIYSQFVYLGTE